MKASEAFTYRWPWCSCQQHLDWAPTRFIPKSSIWRSLKSNVTILKLFFKMVGKAAMATWRQNRQNLCWCCALPGEPGPTTSCVREGLCFTAKRRLQSFHAAHHRGAAGASKMCLQASICLYLAYFILCLNTHLRRVINNLQRSLPSLTGNKSPHKNVPVCLCKVSTWTWVCKSRARTGWGGTWQTPDEQRIQEPQGTAIRSAGFILTCHNF